MAKSDAPREVEINLRVPDVKEPVKDSTGWPIRNSDVRFLKRVSLAELPAPGAVLELVIRPSFQFRATVVRVDWHDEKEMFVVACKYSDRSMPRPEYLALLDDHEWIRKPLLS